MSTLSESLREIFIPIKEIFVDEPNLIERLGLSKDILITLREKGELIQGIHFTDLNMRLRRYNLPLMIDWMSNRHDPAAHQLAIENWQANLPSNQSRLRGRPRNSKNVGRDTTEPA